MFSGIDEVKHPEFNRRETRNSELNTDWDIDNSITIKFTTNLEESFTMIATPRKGSPNVVSLVVMSATGEASGFIAGLDGVFDVVPSDEFDPIDIGNGFIRHRPDGWNWTIGQHIGCALAGFVAGGGILGVAAYASCMLIIDNLPPAPPACPNCG